MNLLTVRSLSSRRLRGRVSSLFKSVFLIHVADYVLHLHVFYFNVISSTLHSEGYTNTQLELLDGTASEFNFYATCLDFDDLWNLI